MRRSRMGRTRAISQTLVFVIIALAFVGSGYLIGKYFLASLLHRSPGGQPVSGDDPSKITTATGQVQTSSLTLYRVQIGAFANKDNADKLVDEALKKGVGAAVMSPDPLYKVYCGIAGSKDAADRISSTVQPKLGASEKPYVGTMQVSSYSFSFTGNSSHVESLKKAFDKADKAVASLLSYLDSTVLGQDSQVDLSAMETDLGAVKSDLAKITPETGLARVHSSAVAVTEELYKAVRTAQEIAGGNGTKAASAIKQFVTCMDLYVRELSSLAP